MKSEKLTKTNLSSKCNFAEIENLLGKEIESLFTSNFETLSPRIYDFNAATLKVNASFEYEGEFTDPELIVNAFDNEVNEEEVKNMVDMFKQDLFEEVNYKRVNDDYFITAGCPEVVYSLKLQVMRIA